MSLLCSRPKGLMLLCHGCLRHQMLQIRCGNTKESRCNASQCHIHHIIKGKAPEHRCMTDWARTNLVCSDRLHRSDRSQQRLAQSHPPRQEYHIKNKEEDVQPMQVDSGKTTTDDVIKIGDVNVVVKDVGKKPMAFEKSAQTDPQKHVLANDHEASSSGLASKYHQPMCCPPGLSHSQKRRL